MYKQKKKKPNQFKYFRMEIWRKRLTTSKWLEESPKNASLDEK